ncbi:MAG: hypothetical protein [Cressdnaviricota sp.]|nr:MAG: hypothetical protein [Cressdnaviricota sp.]
MHLRHRQYRQRLTAVAATVATSCTTLKTTTIISHAKIYDSRTRTGDFIVTRAAGTQKLLRRIRHNRQIYYIAHRRLMGPARLIARHQRGKGESSSSLQLALQATRDRPRSATQRTSEVTAREHAVANETRRVDQHSQHGVHARREQPRKHERRANLDGGAHGLHVHEAGVAARARVVEDAPCTHEGDELGVAVQLRSALAREESRINHRGMHRSAATRLLRPMGLPFPGVRKRVPACARRAPARGRLTKARAAPKPAFQV